MSEWVAFRAHRRMGYSSMNDPRRGDGGRPGVAPAGYGVNATRRVSGRGPQSARAGGSARISYQPFLVVGVVLLVGALLAVGTLRVVEKLRPSASTSTPPPPMLRLAPVSDGLRCVSQIAWSPSGGAVAALGNTENCGASALDRQSTRIFIYNARNGELIEKLQPDLDVVASPDIEHALSSIWTDPRVTPQLTYTNLVWTPDGKALLLPFQFQMAGQTGAATVNGLLREGVSQSALTSVWFDRLKDRAGNEVEQWDLTGVVPTETPAPALGETYHWNSDGTLASDSAPASGAVGAPTGGQSFTIWQSGSLNYLPPSEPGGPAVTWSAKIAPVSPDGRYFYPAVAATGALVPPSTANAGSPLASLAPHDKALQSLAQRLAQIASTDATAPLLVTWRPDGKLLASVKLIPATTAGILTVSIYDTTTGALVKQLTPSFTGLIVGPASAETLQWSPDGKQLLLSDSAYGSITLWGPGELPA